MYRYMICDTPNEEIFYKQCDALEKNIKEIDKKDLLEDVDGSKIQVYYYNNKNIKVINSYYENELFVESEIELEKFFKNPMKVSE